MTYIPVESLPTGQRRYFEIFIGSNICIYMLNGNETLKNKVKEIGVFSLSISNATLAELYFGAYNSQKLFILTDQ